MYTKYMYIDKGLSSYEAARGRSEIFIVSKNKHQLNSTFLQYTVLTSDCTQKLGSHYGRRTSIDHANVLHGLDCLCP